MLSRLSYWCQCEKSFELVSLFHNDHCCFTRHVVWAVIYVAVQRVPIMIIMSHHWGTRCIIILLHCSQHHSSYVMQLPGFSSRSLWHDALHQCRLHTSVPQREWLGGCPLFYFQPQPMSFSCHMHHSSKVCMLFPIKYAQRYVLLSFVLDTLWVLNWFRYCQTSNIKCTWFLTFNVFRLVLQLSWPNPFKAWC